MSATRSRTVVGVPRKPRIEVPGGLFHVTARGVHGEVVFETVRERQFHRLMLAQAVKRYAWICIGFCQMGTHFHLVLMTPMPTLARGMQFLNGQYADFVNEERERAGHLFGGRYRSAPIETDAHLLETCRYVALNPVRAGLCDRPEDWRWSSFAATAGLVRVPSYLSVGEVLGLFGGDRFTAQTAYSVFVAEGLEREALQANASFAA
jgi:REP element-mobilizing transposase RayT